MSKKTQFIIVEDLLCKLWRDKKLKQKYTFPCSSQVKPIQVISLSLFVRELSQLLWNNSVTDRHKTNLSLYSMRPHNICVKFNLSFVGCPLGLAEY